MIATLAALIDHSRTWLHLFGAFALALPAFLSSALALAMMIPSSQPQKFLRGCLEWSNALVDIIEKFSVQSKKEKASSENKDEPKP